MVKEIEELRKDIRRAVRIYITLLGNRFFGSGYLGISDSFEFVKL